MTEDKLKKGNIPRAPLKKKLRFYVEFLWWILTGELKAK